MSGNEGSAAAAGVLARTECLTHPDCCVKAKGKNYIQGSGFASNNSKEPLLCKL